MNLNSPFVQWALKFGLSKSGVSITSGAAWLAAHLVLWIGLPNFIAPAELAQIQSGLEKGTNMFGMALVAAIYAWIVHRQNAGVKILKEQINMSQISTPTLDTSGSIGNVTLAAVAKLTNVSPGEAQANLDGDNK